MKKTIKLTESDLTNLIKRVVKENKYGEEQFSEKIDELNVELHNYYKYSQNFINEITNKLNFLTDEITNSNLSDDDKEVLYNDLDDYEDGYLYPYTDTFQAWKIGPISKVPYTGYAIVRIDKRNGKEIIMVSNKNSDSKQLEMVPNYTVKKVNYNSIPKK